MKLFVVFSMVLATAFGVPQGYGRLETTAAPIIRAYAAPAPVVRAPVAYAAPAPVIRATTAAPYAAPAAYAAPVRAAPSYGGYGASEAAHSELRVAPSVIPIVRHSHESDHKGTYNLNVETGHGIVHTESGSLRDLHGEEGPVGIKSGSYSYTAPDGKQYSVQWTADETGFHATGAHLPTPPPIPEAIQKSLALPRLPAHELDGPAYVPEHELPAVRAPAMASYGGYSAPAAPVVHVLPMRSGY